MPCSIMHDTARVPFSVNVSRVIKNTEYLITQLSRKNLNTVKDHTQKRIHYFSGVLRFEDAKMTPLIKADIGDKVVLVCFATGPLPIKYRWTKDGKPITNAGSINVSDNIVVIKTKTEKDFGTFVCVVDDGKNVTSYPITLQGFTRPEPRTAARTDGKPQGTFMISNRCQ